MKATVLSVGTEILFGSIVNTNTVFISRQLQELGIDVMYHMTVGDNPGRLKQMLAEIYQDCDLVVVSGGLGPTQDDLTKETIADYFGVKNLERPDQLEILMERFRAFKRPVTQNNIKQACFPEGATVLPNPNGTAPGFALEKNGKMIVSMPGPPREMEPMFVNHVRPMLLKMQGAYLYYKTLRTFDVGESMLETQLLPLIDGQTDPTLATYAKDYETTLRVASKRAAEEEAKAAVEDMILRVREIVGDHIYSEDDEPIEAVVVKELAARGMSLAAAESMTGGGFAEAVTEIPGASAVLKSSYVTYASEEKVRMLGVKQETLDGRSAVSPEVAAEMAEGLKALTGADVCISVTGYAGPEGEDVGLYYIGLCAGGKTVTIERRARRGSRSYIRGFAVREMFLAIYKHVLFSRQEK